MRITTHGRYGIRAMLELAARHGQGPVSVRTIAQSQGISLGYLERLMGSLRNAGLVRSVRGCNGGYMLAREPADIKIGQVYRVLEGSIAPVACVDEEGSRNACRREGACAARRLWLDIRDSIARELDSRTLADLSQREPPTNAGSRSSNPTEERSDA